MPGKHKKIHFHTSYILQGLLGVDAVVGICIMRLPSSACLFVGLCGLFLLTVSFSCGRLFDSEKALGFRVRGIAAGPGSPNAFSLILAFFVGFFSTSVKGNSP